MESSQIILLRTLNFRVEDEKNLAGTPACRQAGKMQSYYGP